MARKELECYFEEISSSEFTCADWFNKHVFI